MASMADTLITDEMRSIIGVEMESALSFPVSASDIRKWAMAIYYPEVPPRIFWDEDYAAASAYGGIVAPEEFNPFAWMTKEPEPAVRPLLHGGFERVLGVEPPPHRAVLQEKATGIA
jgi:N-terminal half of MaoC dehydratase